MSESQTQIENRQNNSIKRLIFKIVIYFYRNYPHIIYSLNPFKWYEFNELLKGVSIPKTDFLLDLGCGFGLQTRILAKKCQKVIGVDPNEKSHVLAKSHIAPKYQNRIDFQCGYLEKLHFPDNYFDKVFSFCVIEHIENWNEILNEIYRIMKPGARFIASVDSLATIFNENQYRNHKNKYKVQKYFFKEEMDSILKEIGYKDVNLHYIFHGKFTIDSYLSDYPRIKSVTGIFRLLKDYYQLRKYERKSKETNKGCFLVIKCIK